LCSASPDFESYQVPMEVLIIAFTGGVIITVFVACVGFGTNMLMYRIFDKSLTFTQLMIFLWFDTFILTALVEEGGKYIVGSFSIGKTMLRYITHPYGVVLFTLAGALGFAALENVTYVLNEPSEAAWYLAIARAILSVPLHGSCGALIGVGLARRHFLNDQSQHFFKVIWLPIFIHGLYDFFFVLPVRDGPFKKGNSASHLATEANTVDIGGWTSFFYIFNMCLVAFGIFFAIYLTDNLIEDYRIHKEEDGRPKDPVSTSNSSTQVSARGPSHPDYSAANGATAV